MILGNDYAYEINRLKFTIKPVGYGNRWERSSGVFWLK